MSERIKPRLKLPAAQLRPALPLLAGLCVLLALWVAWGGWGQWQDANLSRSLQASRDLAATGTQHALQLQTDRLRQKLASADVQSALAAGDLAGAARQIQDGWAHIETATILPADLDSAYAALPQGGFGRLAVAEASLAANAPVARIGKDGGAKLLLAAPAKAGDRLAGVAYVRLPLSLATDAIQAANVGSDSYLALREGNYTVLERGDPHLADVAEALATKIPGTDMRIVAGLPDTTEGAFGLGAMPSIIAAAVLLGLAVALWLAFRRGFGLGEGSFHDVGSDEPTLAQAMKQSPAVATRLPPPVVATPDVPQAKAGGVRI